MKKYLIIISLFFTSLSTWCNTQLPWDSLFTTYGLTQSMTEIPTIISPNLDIHYNNGYKAGIWRLTPPIARLYGLTINNTIDERYDIQLSSVAAAKYLKDLLAHYGNEQVAILTYMHGAALIVEIAKIYNIDLHNTTDEEIKMIYNRLQITDKNSQFSYLSSNAQKLSFLDSLYCHAGYIKYKFDNPIRITTLQDSLALDSLFFLHNAMILPSMRWVSEAFIPKNITTERLTDICKYEYETFLTEQEEADKQKKAETQARIAAIKKANAVKIYHVKSGDTLGHIAKRHRVSVRQLKQWNNLNSDMIKIGQKLKIHTN